MKYDLFPALMSINPLDLKSTILTLENLRVKCLHADILDGVYTPYITMGQDYFENIAKSTNIPIEVHFQVDNPIKQVSNLKCELFQRIIIHEDKIDLPTLKDLENLLPPKCNIGIATINPGEPFYILDYIKKIARIDKIVIMASAPGTNNFFEHVYEKIYNLRSLIIKNKLHNVNIQVDGGVRSSNIKKFKEVGANQFVCASALFKDKENLEKTYQALLKNISD